MAFDLLIAAAWICGLLAEHELQEGSRCKQAILSVGHVGSRLCYCVGAGLPAESTTDQNLQNRPPGIDLRRGGTARLCCSARHWRASPGITSGVDAIPVARRPTIKRNAIASEELDDHLSNEELAGLCATSALQTLCTISAIKTASRTFDRFASTVVILVVVARFAGVGNAVLPGGALLAQASAQ